MWLSTRPGAGVGNFAGHTSAGARGQPPCDDSARRRRRRRTPRALRDRKFPRRQQTNFHRENYLELAALRDQHRQLRLIITSSLNGLDLVHDHHRDRVEHLAEDDLCGASRSLDSVRMASKSKKKPPTTSSDGRESHRWREGTAAPRDAASALPVEPLALAAPARESYLGARRSRGGARRSTRVVSTRRGRGWFLF